MLTVKQATIERENFEARRGEGEEAICTTRKPEQYQNRRLIKFKLPLYKMKRSTSRRVE